MKRGLQLTLDPSFAEKEQGDVKGHEESEEDEEEDDGDDDEEDAEDQLERIEELSKALLREFMHKRGYKETLKAFDAECPRGSGTLDSRQVLKEQLHMKSVVQRNTEGKREPWASFSILEHMIEDRLFVASGQTHDSRRAHIVTPFDKSTSSIISSTGSTPSFGSDPHRGDDVGFGSGGSLRRKKKKDGTVGYELDSSGSKIMLAGEIELSARRIRSVKEMPSNDLISDLKRGKLINDVKELDLTNEIALGSGASGRVSKVLHVPSGQYVAVKKISIHDEHLRKEILKELHLLYSNAGGLGSKKIIDVELLHGSRYIIRFFGAFFHEGSVLIALECMVGSLEDALGLAGTIPEEVLRAISFQTVYGLYYLHKAHHIQHRDIKTANLLLSNDGRVKVSDFGVASDENKMTMAPAQTFIGTVIYMSPERLRGDEYGATADIWSLGLVLLQAATGQHPFRGMDMYKIMHIATSPKLPKEGFSKEFASFVDYCLQVDPAERPTSEVIRRHKWISNMTEGRSERIIMEWASPIIMQLEMKRANSSRPGYTYDILDSAIS
eukprot:GGOE01062034.1.p1 GENE.GGOE01062034.1~~GGOE01062034.1.p1  ORF type:complete len:554 (-),score=207.83 GGOE01062034.1:165-1826(-)